MASKALIACVLLVSCHRDAPVVKTPTVDAADAVAPQAISPLDPPALAVLLDDPRFADARRKERDRDYAGAAQSIHDTKADDVKCAAAYVEGRMRVLAQQDAAEAFDRASDDACPLAHYAAFRAALAWGKQGKADEAIARAKKALAAPEPLVFSDEASLVLAESLAAKGDRAEALKLWRASVAAHPKGARWVDTEVRIANALLDGVDGEGKTSEALDHATRVVLEAPHLAESSGANAARARAGGKDLDAKERTRRAQAWLDQNKPLDARKDAEQALPLAKGDAMTTCKLHTIIAQTATRAKTNAEAAWGQAIASCTGDALASALYNGGKASWNANKDRDALDRFGRLEREFADHRLADDARFLGALVHEKNGELADFASMLSKLPDDYPKGDMKNEALFRLALSQYTRADLAAAEATLAKGISIDTGNHHWSTAGRFGYFAARLKQQKGDVEGAKNGWIDVIRQNPMQYYMFLSYTRLATIDAALAKKTLDDLVAAEAQGTVLTHEQEAMKKPAFARALRLLEVGEIDGAKKELAIGDSAETEYVYLVSDLFVRAGAPEVAVSWSRARAVDHLSHAPAGRWKRIWEIAYPRAYEDLVKKGAADAGIPVSLAWGIMREESGFYADAKSPTGALGLMQLMPGTAKELSRTTGLPFDEDSLKRPEISIAFGTKLLSSLRGTYAKTKPLAIGAYNAGGGNVNRWLAENPSDFDLWVERIPFEETRGYVKRVISSQGTYAFLHASGELGEAIGLPLVVIK